MTGVAIALLVYPGLALTVALALGLGPLLGARLRPGRFSAAALVSAEGLASIASVLLAALGLALLPWPLHPAAEWPLLGSPLLLWLAIEGAFAATLLVALPSRDPLVTRAAIREAQIGAAGRVVFWLAVGAALWQAEGWTTLALPGRLLLLAGGLLALPAAAGIGPFGAERSLGAGTEHGLDDSAAGLLRFARTARAAALLAALIGSAVPGEQIQAPLALLLVGAGWVLAALVLRRAADTLPRATLPAALHWCWWRALPPAVFGLVYLLIV